MISGLFDGRIVLQIVDASKLWKQYSKVMKIRRPKSILDHNRFGSYLKREKVFLFNKSICIGRFDSNYFCVSHFCPFSKREGVEMLKELRKASFKVLFAVTEDMVGMLEKLGYSNQNSTIEVEFRGEKVLKHILTN
ncbi:hypothetical protein A2619_01075 [candidate division WWE3 bacterium RIFOXYD1_FULL_39_9]|uniref:N-acetyltransferase domain-containing protein n=1 Tax=candidate division WWE3 bacterium RIFOXYD1_FULL_39_9 TaxID=1802649 RepID=A0A1F4X680_UNCKA|nr:MAG: hypothetical protein A2619_01075 [candidate division WWE3 bacterium RIFOXYD1_FULL_39_9]